MFFKAAAQEEVREVFNRCLHAVLMDSEDRMIKGQPNKVIDEINKRNDLYLEAIQTPHHMGPAWDVGKVFAKLCGDDRDPRIVDAGAVF